MRVIAGRYKRRRLKSVPHEGTRSTKDRVKETLFNMLVSLEGDVLDAFAGSGALGIEALSRGARHADFIEWDAEAFSVLEENLIALDAIEDTRLFEVDAGSMLIRLEGPYDTIFLDPPYGEGLIGETLETIAERRLLAENGVIAVLKGEDESFTFPEVFTVYKTRNVGVTDIILLEWSE